MVTRCAALLIVALVAVSCHAATYTVTNSNDAGAGSLREAITAANADGLMDEISFDTGAARVMTIMPVTALPIIVNPLTINGDTDADGRPNVRLNGDLLESGNGLQVSFPEPPTAAPPGLMWTRGFGAVHLKGLSVIKFPGCGIQIAGGTYHSVVSCHLGVNAAGTAAWANGDSNLHFTHSNDWTVGSSNPAERNVIYCGSGYGDSTLGISASMCFRGKVIGNYFGMRADGTAQLAPSVPYNTGMLAQACGELQIGGLSAGERNCFSGAATGLRLSGTGGCTIRGNYFGLAPDGATSLPLTEVCLELMNGSHANTIGGTNPAAANVFAGGGDCAGVLMWIGGTTADNYVRGNLFGSNAAGTADLPLSYGVKVGNGAGAQVIGGASPSSRNYFTIQPGGSAVIIEGGSGSSVRYNRIGMRKDNTPADLGIGVWVAAGMLAYVRDNVIVHATDGVALTGSDAEGRIYGNTFRFCTRAVRAAVATTCRLGDLSTPSTGDDGGNVFRANNTWAIYNESANAIKAEGNSFDTVSVAKINAKIHDKLDDPSLGLVDYTPLGAAAPAPRLLALSGAAAYTCGDGVDLAFTLSAPAQVTVEIVNLAGRTVARPLADAPREQGTQRVLWTRRTVSGTPAPAGQYLAKIRAHAADGGSVQVLAPVVVR